MSMMKRCAELVLMFFFPYFLSAKLLLQQYVFMCKRRAMRKCCHSTSEMDMFAK